jgi:hypothetical protein
MHRPTARRPFRLAALTLALTLIGFTAVVAADLRTWTDSTGKFTIKAKFVSLADGKVTLEQEDGSKVEIELTKLSAADQKVAQDLAKGGDNPFKPKTAAGSPAKSAAEPPLATVDWSGARAIDLNPAQSEWKVSVGAAPSVEGLTHQPVRLPQKVSFFEQAKGLVLNPVCKRAAVGYTLNDPRQKAGGTRVVLCDLASGQLLGTASAPGQFAPVALADDGNRVLMRRDDFGLGNQDRLEVWKLDGSNVTKTLRWVPYDDLHGAERDVKWATLLDEQRAVTVSASGKLVAWQLDPLKPLYTLLVQGNCLPGLSPDRKLLAFSTGHDVGVLDLAAGRVVALQTTPQTQFPTLAFSPSGKWIACAAFDKLYVWDTATGKQERESGYYGLHVGGQALWTDDDHILLGNRTLFDLETQVKLWEYNGGELVQYLGGKVWFEVSQDDRAPGAIVPATVPQANVTAALKKAMAESDFFVLKPGTTVAIDVSGLADADQRDKVRTALEEKLKANDCQVGESGTITLAALTEVGKERDVSYHTFGRPGSRTYKVKEHFSRLKFLYQGKPAWETSAGNVPFFVRLKEDQTMQQYLKEHEKPNYDWFTKVELPKLLTKPTGRPTLGTSQVTTAGVR